jgi:chemotaxis protein MotA
MDFGTAIGLLAGFGIIAVGVINGGGDLFWFFNLNSILIVFGGTFMATMVNYPIKNILGLWGVIKNAFSAENHDYRGVIDKLVEMGTKARKNGVLSLEADLPSIEDNFLRNGIELAINERDPARLRNYLNLELNNIQRRHKMGQEIFFYMGAYSPAFGMLGTIIGLIIMMNNFSGGQGASVDTLEFDVAQKFADLLGGMGIALITTFYGVLLANLVFLPIGGKLTRKSQEELMLKTIVVEGIVSIHAKEHPLLMREKLMTFVPQSVRGAEAT